MEDDKHPQSYCNQKGIVFICVSLHLQLFFFLEGSHDVIVISNYPETCQQLLSLELEILKSHKVSK